MRVLTILWILVVASPLSAQTERDRLPPFNDTVQIEFTPSIELGRIPIINHLLSVQLPQPPNSNAQVQQAIEKLIPGAREVLVMDLDSVLLASAAKSFPGSGSEEDAVKGLLAGLKSIHIRGFEIEGAAPDAYRRKVQPIRDLLKAPEWVRYAANTSGNSEMEIWSARWGNSTKGVLLLSITGGKQVFIMNVTGNLRPDQLIYLSGVLGIPNFILPLGQH